MSTDKQQMLRDFKRALSMQRTNLGRCGTICLKGVGIPSLSKINVQQKLKKLDVSNTNITSFDTLPAQPILTTIIANNTQVDSYVGLSRQPRLNVLSLKNTPISQREYFRIEALIVVGQHLTKLNGEVITPKERKLAVSYPQITRMLIESGWDLVVPCPSTDEIRRLCVEYNIRIKGVDKQFTNENATQYFKPPPQIPIISDMHQTVVGVIPQESTQVRSRTEESVARDNDLIDALAAELIRIGIQVPRRGDREEAIVSIVEDLVEIVKCFEPVGDIIDKMANPENDISGIEPTAIEDTSNVEEPSAVVESSITN